MDWPEVLFTPEGAVDFDAMAKAYNARKWKDRRQGKQMGIEPAIIPRNDPFFPDFGG